MNEVIAIMIVVLRGVLLGYLCVDGGNGINAILMPPPPKKRQREKFENRLRGTLS